MSLPTIWPGDWPSQSSIPKMEVWIRAMWCTGRSRGPWSCGSLLIHSPSRNSAPGSVKHCVSCVSGERSYHIGKFFPSRFITETSSLPRHGWRPWKSNSRSLPNGLVPWFTSGRGSFIGFKHWLEPGGGRQCRWSLVEPLGAHLYALWLSGHRGCEHAAEPQLLRDY